MRTRLLYHARPGQIKLGGPPDDPLVNVESVPIALDGFAIPAHIDGHGHPVSQGFDITDMLLTKQTQFASAQAVVLVPSNTPLVWNQCPEALQWADEQVPFVYGRQYATY